MTPFLTLFLLGWLTVVVPHGRTRHNPSSSSASKQVSHFMSTTNWLEDQPARCLSRNDCVILSPKNKEWMPIVHQLRDNLSLPLLTFEELQEIEVEPEQLLVEPPPAYYALVVEDYHLDDNEYVIGLQAVQLKQGKQQRIRKKGKPWWVDFASTTKRTGDDGLIKAVSPHNCHVVDLTAGWGQDAWQLAQARNTQLVTMVERNPIVATLLRDGLRRLSSVVQSTNLRLRQGDGIQVAMELATRDNEDHPVEIVYLDPMFPPRTKSAAVKKPMQLLHGLLNSQMKSSDDDVNKEERMTQEQSLLYAALQLANQRVVVKRPIHAPYLGTSRTETGKETRTTTIPEPSYSVCGSISRWDVYQPKEILKPSHN